MNKICRKCGQEFPATLEFFHKQGKRLSAKCKICANAIRREYCSRPGMRDYFNTKQQEYNDKNREIIRKTARNCREKHKDHINQNRRERYANDAEYRQKSIEYDRNYKASGKRAVILAKPENRAAAIERNKRYRADPKNQNKINARMREYRKENPEIFERVRKKIVETLPDHYVIQQLRNQSGVKSDAKFDTDTIETKRLLLLLKRELK